MSKAGISSMAKKWPDVLILFVEKKKIFCLKRKFLFQICAAQFEAESFTNQLLL